jgi:nicotinamide-nucleotide amidase
MAFDSLRLKQLMESRGLTLAVAESLTSGRIQAAVGAVSGASHYFLGGITVYTLDQKVAHLHIDREHASQVDCVSERVAIEMSKGVAELFDSDYSVSSTGYAEEYPAAHVNEPFAHVAIWMRRSGAGKVIHSERIGGVGLSRTEMQQHVAECVLARLQEHFEREVRVTRRS